MNKMIRITALLVFALLLNSCASGYKQINPTAINYGSKSLETNVLLEYKYDLLFKKYKKNETKNDVKLIAVKITNNSDRDITFGKDLKLTYENSFDLNYLPTDKLFKTLKQSPASYLWYLLLSPLQLYSGTKTTSNGYYTTTEPANTFPIGLIVGPGIAGGNIIAASSANKKFKNDLTAFDITGRTIKQGETVFGLIGVNSNSYESIKVKMQ